MSLLNSIANLISWILGSAIRLVMLGLWIYCIYDCVMRVYRNPLHKWAWLAAIIFIPPFGALAYLIFGREQGIRYR